MIRIALVLTLILSLSFSNTYSQSLDSLKKLVVYNGSQISADASALVDKGKVIEAANLAVTVKDNDTLARALLNFAINQFSDSSLYLTELKQTIERYENFFYEDTLKNLEHWASYYILKKDYPKVEEVISKIARIAPFNDDKIIYRSNMELSKDASAVNYVALMNVINQHLLEVPKDAGSLYQSSFALWKDKQYSLMYLYLYYGLAVVNNYNSADALASIIEKLVKRPSELHNNYKQQINILKGAEDLDLILQTGVALNSKYKTNSRFQNFYMIRQMHLLLENIDKFQSDDVFINKVILPLFKKIKKEKLLDQYASSVFYVLDDKKGNKADFTAMQDIIEKNLVDSKLFDKYTYKGVVYKIESRNNNGSPSILVETSIEKNGQSSKAVVLNSDGRLQIEGNLIKLNGAIELSGLCKFYLANGKLESVKNYTNTGKQDGRQLYYYFKGGIKDDYSLVKGEMAGNLIAFFQNENKDYEYNIVKGKANGIYYKYHKNGFLASERAYKDGERNGETKEYDTDGSLSSIVNYVNGKEVGISVEYFDNGNVKEQSTYKNGVQVGKVETFYRNGSINTIASYEQGEIYDSSVVYYRNGNKYKVTRNLKPGKPKNYMLSFFEDNVVYLQQHFMNGSMTEAFTFNKEGKLEGEYKKLDKGTKTINLKISGGSIGSVEFTMVKGNLNGPRRYLYTNGDIESIDNFENDLKEGEQRSYHQNGKLLSIYNYSKDKLDGLSVEYYMNGNLKNLAYYKNGELCAEFISYYVDGSVKSRSPYPNGLLYGKQSEYSVEGKLSSESFFADDVEIITQVYDKDSKSTLVNIIPSVKGTYENRIHGYLLNTCNYKNGFTNGEVKYYYPDGKVRLQYYDTLGLHIGRELRYDPVGRLESDLIRDKVGNIQGLVKVYSDGFLYSTTQYVPHKDSAFYTFYNQNGNVSETYGEIAGNINGYRCYYDIDTKKLTGRLRYDNESIVSYSYEGTDGKMVPEILLSKTGNDEIKAYYSNGKPSMTGFTYSGLRNGDFFRYYFNGNIASKESFVFNLINGKRTSYYSSGKVMKEQEYIMNEETGTWVIYNPDGSKLNVENYKLGSLSGLQEYYDNKGKLLKRINLIADVFHEVK